MVRRFGVMLCAALLCAHVDPEVQIAALTQQMRQEPRDARLYLKRAGLQRSLGRWDLALADLDRCEALAPRLAAVDLVRGRTLLEARRPREARAALDRFLGRQPGHAEALILRARALVELGHRESAVADYEQALARHPAPRPEHYLERARLQAPAAALRGLDRGIARLGPVVTLELAAIELDLQLRNYDSALARLDRIAAQAARKDPWLARRAEIERLRGVSR
jgi:tetratricopeptide (TPR) repeat protein